MISSIQSLLDVNVGIEPWTGQNAYGDGSYGVKRTVRAHIYQGRFWAMGGNGESLPARYKVILGEAIQVDPRDRITLPKEYGVRDANGVFQPDTPPILQALPAFVRGQFDHTELILG